MADGPDDQNIAIMVEAFRRSLSRESAGQSPVDSPPIIPVNEIRLRQIMREEIDEFSERECVAPTGRLHKLKEEIAQDIFDRDIVRTMGRLGLRIDDANIDDTRHRLDGLFRMHETAAELTRKVFMTIAGSFGLAIAGLIGWLVTSSHGGGPPTPGPH